MRNPPLATIEEMEAVRSRQRRADGEGWEPPIAVVSINRLADMHEAMDIEEELLRRQREAEKAAAKQ